MWYTIPMETRTLSLNENQLKQLEKALKDYPTRYDLEHTLFQAKLPDGVITAYRSKKVVFMGAGAKAFSEAFLDRTRTPMAGSDEVGTGDYFGPVVVVACYISEQDYEWLLPLKIMDSKAMTDQVIIDVAPTLINKLTHSLLVLDNPTYNRVHKEHNMNAIKARLHHSAYAHLKKKLGFLPDLSVVDQFAKPDFYYRYLDDDYGITHLHFETKAENKYLAVACASVIARYYFLEAIKQLSKKYHFVFPLGAGALVDQKGRELLKQQPGFDLNNVAKLHFKNTMRITE